jgi:sugar transferase (PEP-CTERM/EpsH1 system associated)
MSMISKSPDAARDRAPVKIVHVVLSLNVGGLERLVLKLLAHTDRTRYAPLVCALDEPGVLAPELNRLGIPLQVMSRGSGLSPRFAFRLADWLRREDVKLVHTHNASPHFYGAIAVQLLRARALRGDLPRIVHTKHGRSEPENRRKVLVNRIASALTDRVVAVSDDIAALTVEIERVHEGKVVTILNGVDTEEYRPAADPRPARARLGVPEGGFHVGCVARLAAIKDHGTLLKAFARLREGRPAAHLTLIGDGAERRALEQLRTHLGLTGAVTFAGERGDIAPLLPAFDVFALSSLSEGISLTLLEAAAAGLPVVATNVGGNTEVVVEGASGLLVPPRDPERFAAALEQIARLPDRRAMGQRGRDRVERRFSIERMARAYHDLYAELLGLH